MRISDWSADVCSSDLFELRGAQARYAVAQGNAENQLGTLQYTDARLKYGRGTEFDQQRARAQLATTRARVPDQQIAISNATHRLAVLCGLEPEALNDELVAGDEMPDRKSTRLNSSH